MKTKEKILTMVVENVLNWLFRRKNKCARCGEKLPKTWMREGNDALCARCSWPRR